MVFLFLFFYIHFYKFQNPCLIFCTVFFAILVCLFNSLPNGEHSNLMTAAAFSDNSFSGKTSLPLKNSYLLTFPDDRAEILAICLLKLY